MSKLDVQDQTEINRFCPVLNSTLPYAAKKSEFPTQLLIYHAGTGKTVYIGAVKLTTGFVFLYFCLLGIPYWSGPDPDFVKATSICLAGMIPGAWVFYTTMPFVTYVHLRLPLVARQSREALLRYVRKLPPNASVDITTLNVVGLPKVTPLLISELSPVRQRFGIANFGRNATALNAKRPLWAGKAVDRFSIRGGSGTSRESGIWEVIEKTINNRPLLNKNR